jgi:DNA invertase Pin-like site-specific DNA recombinase
MWQMIGVLAELERSLITNAPGPGREIRAQTETHGATASPCAHKLIDDGQRREDVAALFKVSRGTLYRALANGVASRNGI